MTGMMTHKNEAMRSMPDFQGPRRHNSSKRIFRTAKRKGGPVTESAPFAMVELRLEVGAQHALARGVFERHRGDAMDLRASRKLAHDHMAGGVAPHGAHSCTVHLDRKFRFRLDALGVQLKGLFSDVLMHFSR